MSNNSHARHSETDDVRTVSIPVSLQMENLRLKKLPVQHSMLDYLNDIVAMLRGERCHPIKHDT